MCRYADAGVAGTPLFAAYRGSWGSPTWAGGLDQGSAQKAAHSGTCTTRFAQCYVVTQPYCQTATIDCDWQGAAVGHVHQPKSGTVCKEVHESMSHLYIPPVHPTHSCCVTAHPAHCCCVAAQVSEASASGADLDTLSEELFKQLSTGQTVNLGSLFNPAKHAPASAAAVRHTSSTAVQQQQHMHRAAQAISAAATAAAANQGTTPAALLGTADAAKGQDPNAPASLSGLIRVASEIPAETAPR